MSRTAIVVTDRRLLPIVSGNQVRILGLIDSLRSLGWKVALAALPDVGPRDEVAKRVDRFLAVQGKAFPGGALADFDAKPFARGVQRLMREVGASLVIAEYVWMAGALEGLPFFVRRVIDCHDLFHQRTEQFEAAGLHPWLSCTREEELKQLSQADTIVTTQFREAGELQQMLPRRRVQGILTPIDLPYEFARTSPQEKIVLAVGARHPGNEAIVDFAKSNWPRIIDKVPDARLVVVGSIADLVPDLVGVERVGLVESVAPYYAKAAVVVCPVVVGTGVKTKLLEGLRYGRAVVATRMATDGLPLPAQPAWVTVEDFTECADAVVSLLNDPGRRAQMESEGFAYGERYVSMHAFERELARILPGKGQVGIAQFLYGEGTLLQRKRWKRRADRPIAIQPAAHYEEMPLRSISVIIPSLNWSKDLIACLTSLGKQTVTLPVQIVVVINSAAQSPLPEWPGVTVIYEGQRGPASTRNAGARAATGDVLAFIDSDCTADPEWLAQALKSMQTDACGIFAGAITRSGRQRNVVSLYDSVTYLLQESYVRWSGAFVTANVIVHRRVFERLGPFDTRFNEAAFEDWDWARRARQLSLPIRYAPDAIVDHPCMLRLRQIRMKSHRLARGEVLFAKKYGERPGARSLPALLRSHTRRAWRNSQVGIRYRLALVVIAVFAAYWRWQGFRAANETGVI